MNEDAGNDEDKAGGPPVPVNAVEGPPALGPTDASIEVAAGVAEFAPVAAPGPKGLDPPPVQEPYNAQKTLDSVRARLAFRLVWVLVGVLAAGVLLLLTQRWTHIDKVANVGSTFTLVFSSMVTLVSAATGFYFGQSTTSSSGK